MKHRLAKLGLWAACVLLSGCASYIDGVTVLIHFDLSPPESVCTVTSKHKRSETVTTGSSTLKALKGRGDITLVCTADGHESKTVTVAQRISGLGLLSIPIDGGMTDLMTGAMWTYPGRVEIVLDKIAQP